MPQAASLFPGKYLPVCQATRRLHLNLKDLGHPRNKKIWKYVNITHNRATLKNWHSNEIMAEIGQMTVRRLAYDITPSK